MSTPNVLCEPMDEAVSEVLHDGLTLFQAAITIISIAPMAKRASTCACHSLPESERCDHFIIRVFKASFGPSGEARRLHQATPRRSPVMIATGTVILTLFRLKETSRSARTVTSKHVVLPIVFELLAMLESIEYTCSQGRSHVHWLPIQVLTSLGGRQRLDFVAHLRKRRVQIDMTGLEFGFPSVLVFVCYARIVCLLHLFAPFLSSTGHINICIMDHMKKWKNDAFVGNARQVTARSTWFPQGGWKA